MTLGGCAHAPMLEIGSTGQWPAGDKPSFGFGHLDGDGDPSLRTRIADCLTRKGMSASASPIYLVQLGLSDRPAGSDILPAEGGDATRNRAAARRRSQSLAVSITDIGSGREVYRIRVTEHYRRAPAPRPPAALADAACGAIGETAPAPPPS